MQARNFVAAGVGGQGTLVASGIIAEVGLRAGYAVQKSEVHGMAQRGGAVISHVRWGEHIASPLCEKGAVDFFLALEQLEALRWRSFLRPGGTIIYNHERRPPTSTVFGNAKYPDAEIVHRQLAEVAGEGFLIKGTRLAQEIGHVRTMNVILLGALASLIDDVDFAVWQEVVSETVPAKALELNLRAFDAGVQAVRNVRAVAGR